MKILILKNIGFIKIIKNINMKTATLKQLMAVLSINKVSDEDRAQLVYSWTNGRTTSARGLTEKEMLEIVQAFNKNEGENEDVWRKRVIAAIFGLFDKMNRKASIDIVKGTACRATGYNNFNKIPKQRLISLYNAFTNAQKDLHFAKIMVNSYILKSKNCN